MVNLNANNLNVNMVYPISATAPIRFRRYTVSYLENMENIYLTIATYFDTLGLGTLSIDKVYGQWAWFVDNIYDLNLFVFVGNYPYQIAKNRYDTFVDILPVAITSIVNGDRIFLTSNPCLLNSKITVRFISSHPTLNRTVDYGNIRDFIF
ncbi:staygreen family protein [Clostridioides difficile]|nr:staygreen family protein [Clostridioides difficile]